MGMTPLRDATTLRGARGKSISFDDRDFIEVVGQDAGRKKAREAAAYNNCVLTLHCWNPHYCTGAVDASTDRTNFTTLARSAELVRVSTPAVPALRWVTFSSTWSSEEAAPLCRNVSGNAKRERRDGGTKPFAPRGAAPFWRTSFSDVGSKVPTLRNSPINS